MKVVFRTVSMSFVLLCVLSLYACKGGVSSSSEVKDGGYTKAQTMIIVATERNRYQNAYSDQIWKVHLDEKGTTFEQHLLREVRIFLEELKTVNLLAKERGISLSQEESAKVQELSKVYYADLTQADKEYIGADEADIRLMYQEYCLANKLVNELTKDVDTEISDSDARLIHIQQIRLEDETAAQAVYEQVKAEGADFAAIARSNPDGVFSERKIGKGEENKEFEEVAFRLQQDEISEILRLGGNCYILKCINYYDEEATLARKSQLSLDQKNQAFRKIYDEFSVANKVVFSDMMWNEINMQEGSDATTNNFFSLYITYFPE